MRGIQHGQTSNDSPIALVELQVACGAVGEARADPADITAPIVIASAQLHLISLPVDQPSPASTTVTEGECTTGSTDGIAVRSLYRGGGAPDGESEDRRVGR